MRNTASTRPQDHTFDRLKRHPFHRAPERRSTDADLKQTRLGNQDRCFAEVRRPFDLRDQEIGNIGA